MAVGFLLTTACKNAATPGNDGAVGISHLRQVVGADNRSQRTFIWRGEKEAYNVEYRVKGATATKLVKARNASFKDGDSAYPQFVARLENLQAGSEYEYRVNDGRLQGAWHSLKTDDGQGFTALIFPDSQSSDYSGWQELVRGAVARNKDAALFINMGDLVDNGEDASQWRAWLNSVEPFSDRLPLAPVIGNHEDYSLQWKMKLPQAYTHLFYVPENGMEKYYNQFYSFDYGPVHFTVLDTNFKEMEDFQPELRQEELAWLERDLAQSKAKWKIVLQHKDIMIYGFSEKSGREPTQTRFVDTGTDFMPLYEKYGVDAVLSAHLHTYRRRYPLRDFKPAADGITYILTGVAGNVRYPDLWDDSELDAGRAPQPETANYMTLRVEDSGLHFKAFLPDGKMFDEVVVKK
jgi:hypothetical protein